ncbi:hypothetical protein MP638_003139 [Amoeboaphelidium occidentale]|nr:hypothetical protein MP638_003139 [Amoeboaphelidium occidentale]
MSDNGSVKHGEHEEDNEAEDNLDQEESLSNLPSVGILDMLNRSPKDFREEAIEEELYFNAWQTDEVAPQTDKKVPQQEEAEEDEEPEGDDAKERQEETTEAQSEEDFATPPEVSPVEETPAPTVPEASAASPVDVPKVAVTEALKQPVKDKLHNPKKLFIKQDSKFKSLCIPSLKECIHDRHKFTVASILFLCVEEIQWRYARFEYFEIPKGDRSVSGRKSFSSSYGGSRPGSASGTKNSRAVGSILRSGSKEHESLLDDDDRDGDYGDEAEEDMLFSYSSETRPRSSSSANQGKAAGSSSALNKKRIPFPADYHNPETIRDIIHLKMPITDNLLLCYAIKTFRDYIHAIEFVHEVFDELGITEDERFVIQEYYNMGVHSYDVKLNLEGNHKMTFIDCCLQWAQEDTASVLESDNYEFRPLLLFHLCCLFLRRGVGLPVNFYDEAESKTFASTPANDSTILSSAVKGYNAFSRVFMRRVCELIKYDYYAYLEIEIVAISYCCFNSPQAIEEQIKVLEVEEGEDRELQEDDEEKTKDGSGIKSPTHKGDEMIVPQSTSKMMLKEEFKEKRNRKNKKRRAMMMTAAAIGGGAILGVSMGLAAPIVGAGLGAALAALNVAGASTFLGGVGGTVLITSGGVLAGTSMGAMKMEKRTKGVEVFRFIPIHGSRERQNMILSVSGWIMSKQGRGRSLPATRRRSQEQMSEIILKPGTSERAKDDEQIPEELLAVGLEDVIVPFMGVSPLMGAHYSLCFDPHILCTLGDALKIFASELISFSAQQILQQTVLATLLSGLSFPLWLVKLGYLVDNPWSLGLDRSRKAGELLADSLCNNVSNGRPVTLVGFSLGARAIFYCLLELAKRGRYGLVEDVFLFGAPILMPSISLPETISNDVKGPVLDPSKLSPTSPNFSKSLEEWRMVVSVVSGRFVNAFCRSDWVLGFLFRASFGGMWEVAGLRPVILDENESMDVTVLHPESIPSDESGLTARPESSLINLKSSLSRSSLKESKSAMKKSNPGSSETLPTPVEKKERPEMRLIENVDITNLVAGHIHYKAAMPMLVKRVCGFATWTEDTEVIEEVVGGEWMEEVDGWWKEEAIRIQRNQRNKSSKAKEKESQ